MLFKEIHESKERCECSCEVYEEEFLWFIAVHNKNFEIWVPEITDPESSKTWSKANQSTSWMARELTIVQSNGKPVNNFQKKVRKKSTNFKNNPDWSHSESLIP